MLLGLELVSAEILDGLRLGGGSKLAVSQFLHAISLLLLFVDRDVVRTLTLPSMSDLTGEKATEPMTSSGSRLDTSQTNEDSSEKQLTKHGSQ